MHHSRVRALDKVSHSNVSPSNTARSMGHYWSNQSQRKALYLDQIHENMKDEKAMEILDQPLNEDKAGQGQNYCIHCE